MNDRPFEDRPEGGRLLAERLAHYADRDDVVVLGLPRGGVPVAYEVARALDAPLDVFVVRKLGVPWRPELAMGAIASGGVRVLNEDVVVASGVTVAEIEAVTAHESAELRRREALYRGDRDPLDVTGLVAVLVDDGLATGATMRAGVMALEERGATRIVVAVPAAPPQSCAQFERDGYEVVCAMTPEPFRAVGLWYRDFSPTTDDEVRDLLQRARTGSARAATAERGDDRGTF
jgi:putative phosphoribosyl transferase